MDITPKARESFHRRFAGRLPSRWLLLPAILLIGVAAFLAGTYHGKWVAGGRTSFHDTRTIPTEAYVDLVNPRCPVVRKCARSFTSLECAYNFVRDEISFDPSAPVAPPSEVLAARRGSCLGKAILLCSLYRAMGVSHEQVRVVTGEVATPRNLVEHAWVELEKDDVCLQQDATSLLGKFSPEQFVNDDYTDAFIRRKRFCFNDAGFALISQLDTLPDGVHPPIPD